MKILLKGSVILYVHCMNAYWTNIHIKVTYCKGVFKVGDSQEKQEYFKIQQYVYELIVLAVPIKRVHPGVEDGTLNSDILKKLEELSPKIKDIKEDQEETDPRWNTLKKLLTDK